MSTDPNPLPQVTGGKEASALTAGAVGVLDFESVSVRRDGRYLLRDITFTVGAGETWAVLGPNGAGKSTLMNMAAALAHPTDGAVRVLGQRLGRVDMRHLRSVLGHVNPRIRVEEGTPAVNVVLSGQLGANDLPRRYKPAPETLRYAHVLAERLGIEHVLTAPWVVLSQGERGRVLIARALLSRPHLLLLDEPTTGLDLAARETLLRVIAELRDSDPRLALVLVTHHLEELPTSATHGLILRQGEIQAAGPIDAVITSRNVSAAFGIEVEVHRRLGRWAATATPV